MAREVSCENKSRNKMVSSGGFCYTEVSTTTSNNNQTLQNQFTTSHQIHDFHHDHDHDHDHHHHQSNNQIFLDSNLWKAGFSNKPQNHHHDQFSETTSGDLIVGPDHNQAWQNQTNNNNNNNNNMRGFMVDESGLRSVFPCENERPIQGLSLTLSSNNPSSIGLQSFEVRQTTSQIHQPSNLSLVQRQSHNHLIQLRNSKFLSPTQELLNEFCSLGTNNLAESHNKLKSHNSKLQWELDLQDHINNNNNNDDGASSSKKHSLYSLEFMELQKRKAKLLSMLEEVERRYKKYCDQMRAVVTSFESVAGPGAAAVYSALASKAMSRHFRCLKDGIVNQIEATRKAMGEKAEAGPGVPGTTRGETPRLRILDQSMRQQRAFQQMSLMESHPWRPQRGLPERSVSVLRAWLFEHFLHPYPSDVDKHILARQTGLSRSQVSNWFINARVRLWKPMVEEMYVEETKEVEILDSTNMAGSSSDAVDILGAVDPTAGRGARSDHNHHDQKPTADQLVRIDSECLSSIVNNTPADKNDTLDMRNSKTLAHTTHDLQRHQNFSRFDHHSYNSMELDFSSYPYPNDPNQGFIGGGGGTSGVSLTLGLQQHHHNHHHNGVSLAFSPGSQSSMFYPRASSDHHHHHHHNHNHHHDHGNSNIDDQVPAVQYSLLDGDQGQNLPYRNLMGAQLLHDLA